MKTTFSLVGKSLECLHMFSIIQGDRQVQNTVKNKQTKKDYPKIETNPTQNTSVKISH